PAELWRDSPENRGFAGAVRPKSRTRPVRCGAAAQSPCGTVTTPRPAVRSMGDDRPTVPPAPAAAVRPRGDGVGRNAGPAGGGAVRAAGVPPRVGDGPAVVVAAPVPGGGVRGGGGPGRGATADHQLRGGAARPGGADRH